MDSNRSQSHSNQTMPHPTQRKTEETTKTGSLLFFQSWFSVSFSRSRHWISIFGYELNLKNQIYGPHCFHHVSDFCIIFYYSHIISNLANIYLFKSNNINNRKRFETCWKLTIKTPNDVIDDVVVFLLLTLNTFLTFI